MDKEEIRLIESIKIKKLKEQEINNDRLKKRTEKAFNSVLKIVKMLKNEYGAEEVYLYGSLARGSFRIDSDIDLYIIGFKGDYFNAFLEAESISEDIEVNLVCAENATENLKKIISEEGVRYE